MMHIALTGSTGLVGGAVADYFRGRGCHVVRIIRQASEMRTQDAVVCWDIPARRIDAAGLEGLDAVVHLAGANIAARRWTDAYKKEILASRSEGTAFLCETLARLSRPPKVICSASAIGFYGYHPAQEDLDESSPAGNDFLAQICQWWERAAQPARSAGIRVVSMRFGVVLSARGGALAKMLPVFKLGFGGRVGSGRQSMSWIALEEIPRIIQFLIDHPDISGALNCVSPQPVSNAEFSEALGQALRQPAIIPFPALMVKIILGEMGQVLLLGGKRVLPKRLIESGYVFAYPDLRQTLNKCLL